MPLAQSYNQAKLQVERLAERFHRNLGAYKRADYKEIPVRVEFIDPLFEALRWDVRNTKGYAEQYKDVIHEDALKVSGATRAPDYCFRIGGTRKCLLEAKKPAVSVLGEISEDELNQGRSILSAIAVGVSGLPGQGFFGLAEQLGKLPAAASDEEKRDCWEQERQALYETWRREFR